MRLNPFCICCQVNHQEQKIRNFPDPDRKLAYMQEILRRFAQAGDEDCTLSLSVGFKQFFSEYWGVPQPDFTEIKKEFNLLMMELEDEIRARIQAAPDPLEAALLYSRTGNYIDFSAVKDVNKETLLRLLDEEKDPLDPNEYAIFQKELASARSLVYLADNCGEIVLDKIVVEILKERYPDLEITMIVRGEPVANDVTMEDAEMCGLTQVTKVIGNGSNIGGTWLPGVSQETRTLLEHADIILSKGQGNFESLYECGLNVYYLFLCKCEWFTRMFDARMFQGMFVNERRVKPSC